VSVSESRCEGQTSTETWWTLGSPKVLTVLNKVQFLQYCADIFNLCFDGVYACIKLMKMLFKVCVFVQHVWGHSL